MRCRWPLAPGDGHVRGLVSSKYSSLGGHVRHVTVSDWVGFFQDRLSVRHYVNEAGFKLTEFLLPLPPEYWH